MQFHLTFFQGLIAICISFLAVISFISPCTCQIAIVNTPHKDFKSCSIHQCFCIFLTCGQSCSVKYSPCILIFAELARRRLACVVRVHFLLRFRLLTIFSLHTVYYMLFAAVDVSACESSRPHQRIAQ